MIDKHEKFKFLLNENGEIELKIEENKYIISKKCATAMRYELYQIIGEKQQWDEINGWKPEYRKNKDTFE